MSSAITDADWPLLAAIPETDLVDMATDLDILIPEVVDHRSILDQCIIRILDRASDENGLPFSKYDREDLEALPPPHREALGQLMGMKSPVTVDAILKLGRRVYKRYAKERPNNPTALLIPTLLPVIARAAARPRG